MKFLVCLLVVCGMWSCSGVLAQAPTKDYLEAAGDSIAADGWVHSMADILSPQFAAGVINDANAAQPGSTIGDWYANCFTFGFANSWAYPDYRPFLIYEVGTNDLLSANTASQDAVKYSQFVQFQAQHGYAVLLCTLLPRSTTPEGEAKRIALNNIIRSQSSSWGASGVIDFTAISGMGAPGDEYSSYYNSDNLHPNAQGIAALAAFAAPIVKPFMVGAQVSTPPPTVTMTVSPSTGHAPLPVTVTFTGSGADTVSWHWADGTADGTGNSVQHTYSAAGSYAIVCTGTNSAGSATASSTVTVSAAVVTPPPPPGGPSSLDPGGLVGGASTSIISIGALLIPILLTLFAVFIGIMVLRWLLVRFAVGSN